MVYGLLSQLQTSRHFYSPSHNVRYEEAHGLMPNFMKNHPLMNDTTWSVIRWNIVNAIKTIPVWIFGSKYHTHEIWFAVPRSSTNVLVIFLNPVKLPHLRQAHKSVMFTKIMKFCPTYNLITTYKITHEIQRVSYSSYIQKNCLNDFGLWGNLAIALDGLGA